ARSEQIDDNPKNYSAEIQHPAEDHPILRLTPTGWNLRQGQESMSRTRTPEALLAHLRHTSLLSVHRAPA
ncbi:MAG: hypothetical protein ACM3Z4_06555, partial [Hyphomicrobiales bacterium]